MSFHLGESAYSLLKLYLPSTSPAPDIASLDRPRQVVARPTHAARQNVASMFRTSVSCIRSLPRHLRPILLGEGRAVDKESSSNGVHVMSIVRLIPLLSSLPSQELHPAQPASPTTSTRSGSRNHVPTKFES
jgi:hypothetical protein